MQYRLSLTKLLEDGTEVNIAEYKSEPGWFISPVLAHLAKQTHEPKPKPVIRGEVPLFDYRKTG